MKTIGIRISLTVSEDSALKLSGNVIFLFGTVSVTASFPWGLWNYLDGLSDLDLTLVIGICLGKCPFHPVYPIVLSVGFCSRI